MDDEVVSAPISVWLATLALGRPSRLISVTSTMEP